MDGLDHLAVVKRGETCVQVNFGRDRGGLRVQVKTHPAVEELFRTFGSGGDPHDISTYGRHWVSPKGDDHILKVYPLTENPGRVSFGLGCYVLDKPGAPWLFQDEQRAQTPGGVINLSWLRLVGTSDAEGVTFLIRQVASKDFLKTTIIPQIERATKKIYQDFLLPVDLEIQLITRETKL